MNVITHNLMAMNAQRQFNIVVKQDRKTAEKLASGYRVNRAADDAAGLSISEKMRNQIRGLMQAQNNIDDGISVIQVADGALSEVHSILHRIEELAVKASNDTNASEDRRTINDEVAELKKELKDIFHKTQFNNKDIFAPPYLPEIEGYPNDMQVFQNELGEYGGISLHNIRYTWEEMGIKFSDDGTFAGQEVTFSTWDGEEVKLLTKKGQSPPMLERQYGWSADDDGIYVNHKLVASWDDISLNKSNVKEGTYSFSYCDTVISFEVPVGDDFSDVKKGINGTGFHGVTTWNSVYAVTESEKAVDIIYHTPEIVVRNSFKNYIQDMAANYSIQADSDGILLINNKDPNAYTHTRIKWEDFRDVTKITSPDTTNNGFPIVDWGLDKDGNQYTDTTFDDTAVYRYHDNVTGFDFDFKLADEASLEAVENGLRVNVSTSLSAPVATSATTTGPNSRLSFGGSRFTYDLHLESGRDFDNAADGFSTEWKMRDDGADSYEITYAVKNKAGGNVVATLTGLVRKDELRKRAEGVDGSYVYDLKLTDGNRNEVEVRIGFGALTDSEKALKDGTAAERAQYAQLIDERFNSVLTNFANADVTTVATDFVRQRPGTNENQAGNVSDHTKFSVVLNPPEKAMDIQSGANRGDLTNISWKAMNLTALGMGGTNTLTFSDSQAAILEVQRAVKIVSGERSKFGAYQNRLEKTFNNNANYSENLQSAESSIRDTDMAEEMVRKSRSDILKQAGLSILAQANQSSQSVMNLLQ